MARVLLVSRRMSAKAAAFAVLAILAGCAGDPPGGDGQEPSATQVPVTGNCIITGCSDQICSDRLVETECFESDQNACFVSATCERGSSGSCSWRPTTDLNVCLARAAMSTPGASTGRGTGSGRGVGGVAMTTPDAGVPVRPQSSCMKTGDFGEICAASPQSSAGAYLPVYACYQTAPCEMQAAGGCGFTPSFLLDGCIWLIDQLNQ